MDWKGFSAEVKEKGRFFFAGAVLNKGGTVAAVRKMAAEGSYRDGG